MKKKINISIGIIVIVFLAILVITKLFKITDLPLQTIGVLFGAVITALITYFLLLGQSQAEELKERNVRVFEERSARFNVFIDKLWDIWDDRIVSLEELNELIKLVSKDIILYTKPATVDKILKHLIAIAEQATPDKSNNKDEGATKLIQNNIFEIINELAKEIGLGGEINQKIKEKLNDLEDKVIPYLIQKDFKKNYIQNIKDTLDQSEEVDFSSVEYKNNFLWCQVKDSNVYFRVGPLERKIGEICNIGIYVEFWNNRNFQNYRWATKGFKKDFLEGGWFRADGLINFNDFEKVRMLYQISKNDNENKLGQDLAAEIIKHYKERNIKGKNIEEIIEECTSQK